jgi:transcriptional regulator with XRE-family HTH domain
VSEGDPENWAAVAAAINDRVRELGWRQRELAERSHVSAAVVREIQRHTVERRRSPRTLEALSVALGWEPEHLDRVLRSHALQPGGHTASDRAALWSRLDSLELRLAEAATLVTELRSDIATVIGHAPGD